MMAQPPRDEHECPDGDDGDVQEDAAHGGAPAAASQPADASQRCARDSEMTAVTSRTVKAIDRDDEY
jgi:hypothetical protein